MRQILYSLKIWIIIIKIFILFPFLYFFFFFFQESDTLTGGNKFVTFDVAGWRVGLGICYDLRFPELSRIYALKGCDLLVSIIILKGYFN